MEVRVNYDKPIMVFFIRTIYKTTVIVVFCTNLNVPVLYVTHPIHPTLFISKFFSTSTSQRRVIH